jgi:hypothetical protein
MKTTPYLSQQPVDDFGLLFSNLKYSANLAATTDTALTIPGNAPRYKAVIKVENNGLVWVAVNSTAAVPAGATFAATTSELINDAKSLCREVKAGDILHFYTGTANTEVSVVLYALGTNN